MILLPLTIFITSLLLNKKQVNPFIERSKDNLLTMSIIIGSLIWILIINNIMMIILSELEYQVTKQKSVNVTNVTLSTINHDLDVFTVTDELSKEKIYNTNSLKLSIIPDIEIIFGGSDTIYNNSKLLTLKTYYNPLLAVNLFFEDKKLELTISDFRKLNAYERKHLTDLYKLDYSLYNIEVGERIIENDKWLDSVDNFLIKLNTDIDSNEINH